MYCSQRGEDGKYRKTNETKEDISTYTVVREEKNVEIGKQMARKKIHTCSERGEKAKRR